MINPWKTESKINPQRENGRREVASDVYLALLMAPLTAVELKVCQFVIHKTWGFGKAHDAISLSQFEAVIPASGRAIQLAQRRLQDLRILHIDRSSKGEAQFTHTEGIRVNPGSPLNSFLFNKHYDTWTIWIEAGIELERVLKTCGQAVGKGDLRVKSSAAKGEKSRQIRVNPTSPTKETLQKKYTKGARQLEHTIEERLGQIGGVDRVAGILREIPARDWWRVERFLRMRYPNQDSGRKAYADAAASVVEQERSGGANDE